MGHHGVDITFYGSCLCTVKVRGMVYVSVKSVVKGMGLSWHDQQRQWRRMVKKYGCRFMSLDVGQSKRRWLMIPLEKLNRWLLGIRLHSMSITIRAMVRRYQQKCAQVIRGYWFNASRATPLTVRSAGVGAKQARFNSMRAGLYDQQWKPLELFECLLDSICLSRQQQAGELTIHVSRLYSLLNNIDWCYHWFRQVENMIGEMNEPLRVAILDHFCDMYATSYDLSTKIGRKMLPITAMRYYPWLGDEEEAKQFLACH